MTATQPEKLKPIITATKKNGGINNMTDAELKRLNELDALISWNNPTDKGRELTEEERKEHSRLLKKLYDEGTKNR